MKKKWDRTAMRIASARYVQRQGMLDVTFENGDHFFLATDSVLPLASHALNGGPTPRGPRQVISPASPNWAKMRISETGDVLEVPAINSIIEIPWDRIRSIGDPEFRAHWSERAVERARAIGRRVRAMRLEAGLTQIALAGKVGASRQLIGNLEAGKIDPRTDLIEHIALALGRCLGEFADE